tara:strand:- start:838 stop:1647 length:810 start_codon:yes stop_codon:yes gene_type:complete
MKILSCYKNRIKIFFCLFIYILFLVCPISLSALDKSHLIFNEAVTHSRAGHFGDAIVLWDEFLESYPDDPIALSNRGNVLLALGDPNGAIADQNRAIMLLPDEPDPHLNRGIAEEALHLWDKAEADYYWVIKRYPNNYSALYNLANVKGAKGEWNEAEILFQKASLNKADFAIARSSHALVMYELGKFDEAEKELRKVIRKYPMLADSRAALSALLWREGNAGEAESHWAAASGIDSRYKQNDWLLNIRRWPPIPRKDLAAFLELDRHA